MRLSNSKKLGTKMLSRFAPNDIVPLRQVNPAGSDAGRILA